MVGLKFRYIVKRCFLGTDKSKEENTSEAEEDEDDDDRNDVDDEEDVIDDESEEYLAKLEKVRIELFVQPFVCYYLLGSPPSAARGALHFGGRVARLSSIKIATGFWRAL